MGWQSAGRRSATGVGMAMIATAALVVAGCSANGAEDGKTEVVITTTMLGDVVGDVAECAGGTARTIMPVGADPHDFKPSSADVTRMVKADLVVTNGLGLEAGLKDAMTNATRDGARVFEVAPKLDPIPFGGEAHGHAEQAHPGSTEAEEHGHEEGSADPHFWHDVTRMARAATLVADELGKITKDAATYQRCGRQVADSLAAVDTQVRQILAAVPEHRRVLITDHHAFGYFAKAYGFEVAAVVIPGGSTLAAPSSAELAEVVEVVKAEQVPVIFSNSALSADLVDTVAKEAGTKVSVVPLFVGSLGPRDSEAATYPDMVLTNAKRMAAALAG